MLFNSLHFLIFFPIVLVLYFFLPHRYRWVLLLIASYYFYISWNPWYISLIIASTLIDYFASLKMEGLSTKRERTPFLILSLISNLGILLFFKYSNFFIGNYNHLTGANVAYLKFLLPVGISFYTFQTLSYTIDVYQEVLKPEKNIGKFALFVSFFPQLVAGPIERATNLLPQFREKVKLNYENFSEGGKRIIWGLFKKVVIADNIGQIADIIYASPGDYNSVGLLLGTYLFTFQIYCDFSGYSDIAIGVAKMMGFNLMENFRIPYISKSIREFWGRWHISLSSWFRDYVYIPLGGNRKGKFNWYRNLVIVFLVSGFWHGANWTFVIWGALHGLYLVLGIQINKWDFYTQKIINRNRIVNFIISLFIFHLVVLGWIFFRAENVGDAFLVVKEILSVNLDINPLLGLMREFGKGKLIFIMLLLITFIISDKYIFRLIQGDYKNLGHHIKINLFGFILALIVLFGFWGEVAFIYFQF